MAWGCVGGGVATVIGRPWTTIVTVVCRLDGATQSVKRPPPAVQVPDAWPVAWPEPDMLPSLAATVAWMSTCPVEKLPSGRKVMVRPLCEMPVTCAR